MAAIRSAEIPGKSQLSRGSNSCDVWEEENWSVEK